MCRIYGNDNKPNAKEPEKLKEKLLKELNNTG